MSVSSDYDYCLVYLERKEMTTILSDEEVETLQKLIEAIARVPAKVNGTVTINNAELYINTYQDEVEIEDDNGSIILSCDRDI